MGPHASRPLPPHSPAAHLYRPDIFDLGRHGNSLGFRMALATNGTLIDDQICGGCRARAYGVGGDYMAEEPFCVYDPAEDRN